MAGFFIPSARVRAFTHLQNTIESIAFAHATESKKNPVFLILTGTVLYTYKKQHPH
jgi:hypothetical protein